MKNLSNQLAAFFSISAIFLVILACSGGAKDVRPAPPEYHGAWLAADGATITIRSDGSADYRSGYTKVIGGKAQVSDSEKTLTITLLGVGPTFKIDKAPSANEMTLDGVVYRKGGSDAKPDMTVTSDDSTSGDVPPDSEVESLIKSSFTDFTDAVEEENFSTFHYNSSKEFQSSYTKDQLKTRFGTFIDHKDKLLPSLRDVQSKSPKFSAEPRIRTEKGNKILRADGEFATSPFTVKFETEYAQESGGWKLQKFKVRM